ncbi:MAG: O-antigen ligase family protein [Bacilli bacterium]|nr:O-antigen ligase family protein [Bacilli bacterium]
MQKIEKFLKGKVYIPAVLAVFYIFWLFSFLSINKIIGETTIYKLEAIEFVIIGIVGAFLLVFFKNTAYFLPWLIFTPFIFARPFDAYTVPLCLYIGVAIVFIGLIVGIFVKKVKLKTGAFFNGLLILCFAIILGGINIMADYFFKQTAFLLLCAGGLLFFYSFLASTSKIKFEEIARLMMYLGIFLLLQAFTYYYLQESFIDSLLNKELNVGWGSTNNIGLMLLLILPFTFYLSISKKTWRTVLYLLIAFLQILAIIFTYSRGSIASMALCLVILLPICFVYARDRWTFISTLNILLLSSIFFFSYSAKYYPDYYQKFYSFVLKIDIDSINGRVPIYQKIIADIKNEPLFGYGMFAPFFTTDGIYIWGHSTVMHTLYTTGLVGVGALLFHFIQKYYLLIKKINIKKIIVIFSFATSGLYGLFDVSYYFMNYMVVFVVLLAVLEEEVKIKGE